MPDPKKIIVKIPKKGDPEKEEKKKGISDKESASENKIELTKQYTDSKKKMETNLNSDKGKSFTEKAQGISIDKEKMSAKPIMIKRKIIKSGGDNGTTKILSEDGKTVKYEGRSNMSATKEALRQNSNKDQDSNSRRENNSNYYNVNSGAKTNLDKEDKESLVKIGKAVAIK